MKFPSVFLAVFLFCTTANAQIKDVNIIYSDVNNFWKAYDLIVATKDSTKQYAYINDLFINKGTPGLQAFMNVREYTAKSYVDAINNYPLFWNSVRKNTYRAAAFKKEIEKGISKLNAIYPLRRKAAVYFTIGALRSNGTTLDSLVLIGSEMAFADKNTVTTEFPTENAKGLRTFFDSNPINDLVLLNMHEYVHTQQNPMVYNLLSECIYEGVAEFVSVKAAGRPSAAPAIAYGKANEAKVKAQFEKDMFSMFKTNYWLWSNRETQFKTRDMGYYIGYALAERFYNKAADKKQAVKDLVELDYHNENQIESYVNGTGYFSAPLEKLYETFEANRPVVTGIKEFKNGAAGIDPGLATITVQFSQKMDNRFRSQDVGALGIEHFPKVKSIRFAEDGLSLTYEVELKPATKYQLQMENGYRSTELIQMKPYLISFETAEK